MINEMENEIKTNGNMTSLEARAWTLKEIVEDLQYRLTAEEEQFGEGTERGKLLIELKERWEKVLNNLNVY